jgi:hypothetical protein
MVMTAKANRGPHAECFARVPFDSTIVLPVPSWHRRSDTYNLRPHQIWVRTKPSSVRTVKNINIVKTKLFLRILCLSASLIWFLYSNSWYWSSPKWLLKRPIPSAPRRLKIGLKISFKLCRRRTYHPHKQERSLRARRAVWVNCRDMHWARVLLWSRSAVVPT